MYDLIEYAGDILLGPLAGVRLEWLRWVMLAISLTSYFSLTVWIANIGPSVVSGWRPFAGCGLTLVLALLFIAAAAKWILPLMPFVPRATLLLSSFALVWIAICGPLIALLFGIRYSHALVAWLLGILAGWVVVHLLVYLWGGVLGGKANVDKFRDSIRLFGSLFG